MTRTLPHGTPEDVKKEIGWLVRCGPKTGLFLGSSSSITPGVPWENLTTLLEPLLIVSIFGMVLLLALAIYLPIWNLSTATMGKM